MDDSFQARQEQPQESPVVGLSGWKAELRFGLDGRVVLLLAAGFLPLLAIFFLHLWERPHYQFFPLALAGVGFLAWSRLRDMARPLQAGQEWVAALLVGVAFLGLIQAVVLYSPWLSSLAAVSCVMGLIWRRGGWPLFRALLPAFVLGLTILPLPLNGDVRLIMELRSLAVKWSSRLLDSLGVVHLLSGNVIELPQQKLLVEEACSGINSVLLTQAICLFYMLWKRRTIWRILICLPSVLASVVLGNIARITLGAWLVYDRKIDILSGWKHELVGLILLALYLMLIVSLDELLEFLMAPIREKSKVPPAGGGQTLAVPVALNSGPSVVAARQARSWWWWAAGGVFALLGMVQLGLIWRHQATTLSSESHLRPGVSFSMPEELDGWRRLTPDSPLARKIETAGIFSQVWNYQRGEVVLAVALDYPFRGYHDVTACYVNAGWKPSRRQRLQAGGGPPWVEVDMEKGALGRGVLWFSTVDEKGRWMEQPVMVQRLLDRWKVEYGTTSYRIQVLTTSYRPLSEADREISRRLFEKARVNLSQQVLDQLLPPAKTQGGAR